MTTKTIKLSLSIPQNVVFGVDAIANKRKLTRSKFISECLQEILEKEKKELLAEGYKAMAKEHTEFAMLSSHAAKEALPAWK
jgi:metal-responsive CopG/Arc/MetJ family transcriptional regulator